MPGPDWSLEANLFAFVCAALVIGLAGTRLAADADHLADGVYLPGSIYVRAGPHELFLVTLAVILNVILLMGLIQRQRRGFANIGFESVTILVVYIGAVLLLAFGW